MKSVSVQLGAKGTVKEKTISGPETPNPNINPTLNLTLKNENLTC